MKTNPDRRLHLTLWGVVALVLLWSGIEPKDRLIWWLEVAPVFIGTGVLLWLYPVFRFSRLVAWWLAIHAIVLMIGGHYTYAEVPVGNWIRDAWHLSRNHYDRLGHFLQGFVPALIAREVLIRRHVVSRQGWLPFVVIGICLALSACYELIEWQAAVWTGSRADAFLGTQGDPWDTQKDMALAGIGATCAVILIGRLHDRSMRKLG